MRLSNWDIIKNCVKCNVWDLLYGSYDGTHVRKESEVLNAIMEKHEDRLYKLDQERNKVNFHYGNR